MKKGNFSSTIAFIAIFLVSTTVIYSRLPTQQLATTSTIEEIQNYDFTAQIARNFADTAFAEALYDEFFGGAVIINPPPTCTYNNGLTENAVETRYQNYLKNTAVNFGACKIINADSPALPPEITITGIVAGTSDLDASTTTAISCEMQNSPEKKVIFKKTHSLKKQIQIRYVAPNCVVKIIDTDSGLQEI